MWKRIKTAQRDREKTTETDRNLNVLYQVFVENMSESDNSFVQLQEIFLNFLVF